MPLPAAIPPPLDSAKQLRTNEFSTVKFACETLIQPPDCPAPDLPPVIVKECSVTVIPARWMLKDAARAVGIDDRAAGNGQIIRNENLAENERNRRRSRQRKTDRIRARKRVGFLNSRPQRAVSGSIGAHAVARIHVVCSALLPTVKAAACTFAENAPNIKKAAKRKKPILLIKYLLFAVCF